MMTSTPFSTLASDFRRKVVTMLSMRLGSSQAEMAELLTNQAVERGLVRREKPVYGQTLAEWGKSGDVPLWAAQTACLLLLENDWRPMTNEEWAGFAALFTRLHRKKSLPELQGELPSGIDVTTAAGWLAAAIEEDAHYKTRKKAGEA